MPSSSSEPVVERRGTRKRAAGAPPVAPSSSSEPVFRTVLDEIGSLPLAPVTTSAFDVASDELLKREEVQDRNGWTRQRQATIQRPVGGGDEAVGLMIMERNEPRLRDHLQVFFSPSALSLDLLRTSSERGTPVRLFVQPVHSRRTTPGWVYHCDVVVGHMETLKDAFDYVRGSAKRQVFVQLVRCD